MLIIKASPTQGLRILSFSSHPDASRVDSPYGEGYGQSPGNCFFIVSNTSISPPCSACLEKAFFTAANATIILISHGYLKSLFYSAINAAQADP